MTGFLGSGKTTLLNRLVSHFSAKSLGLIINDFGKIPVDAHLLNKGTDKRVPRNIDKITNGSIFCTCLSHELVKSLRRFVEISPEFLIIETSGLSDPSTLHSVLINHQLDAHFEVKTSICLIDPVRSLSLARRITAIEKQIINSGLIVINKKDIVTKTQMHEAVTFVKKLNKNAVIITTQFAVMDFDVLDEAVTGALNVEATSCNTVSTRPGSIVLRQKPLSLAAIHAFYESIKEDILRMKGFLQIAGKDYYLSDNQNQLTIEPVEKSIHEYGLSVILPEKNIKTIKYFWTKNDKYE